MTHLRSTVILLVVDLAVLFNLERLDVGSESLVNLQAHVYILALIAVVCVVALPMFQRSSTVLPLFLTLAAYFAVGQFLVPSPRPLFSGVFTYTLITELGLLSITVLLAHDVGRALREFENAVEQVTLPDVKSLVIPMEEADDEIVTELNRSRRYQRPLSVIIVEPEPGGLSVVLHRMVQDAQRAIANHYVFETLGRLLRNRLRRTDLVLLERRDKGRFIILCPETNGTGANDLIERIQALSKEELSLAVACGHASFPNEALTFEEVVHYAESRVVRGPGSDDQDQ